MHSEPRNEASREVILHLGSAASTIPLPLISMGRHHYLCMGRANMLSGKFWGGELKMKRGEKKKVGDIHRFSPTIFLGSVPLFSRWQVNETHISLTETNICVM